MTDDFTAPRPNGPRPRTAAVATGALVVAVAAGLWGAWALRAADARLDDLEARLEMNAGEVSAREALLAEHDRRLAGTLDSLANDQAALGQRVDSLAGTARGPLLATEAEYLVRLASQRVALMRDPAGALALLAAADAALRDIRTADTHAARAAIAADIATLRQAAAVDTEALFLRLEALAAQVEQVATPSTVGAPSPGAPGARGAAGEAPAPGQGWWERLAGALSTLVTVRRTDTPFTPALTDSERTVAALNFRLRTEQAQLALLQRRGAVYAASLAQADAWLARLPGDNPVRRGALHRELTSLRAIDIGQRLPDLTGSLAASRALAARLAPDEASTP